MANQNCLNWLQPSFFHLPPFPMLLFFPNFFVFLIRSRSISFSFMAGFGCKDVWMKDSISIDKKLLGTGDDSKNHQVQKRCWNLPMHKLASVFWSEGRSACQELGDLWGHRLASALDFRNLCISENMQMVTWLQCYWAGWIYVEVEIQLWTASLIFVSWSKVERPFSLQTALPPTRCGGGCWALCIF